VSTLILQPGEDDATCADAMIGDGAYASTNYGGQLDHYIGRYIILKDLGVNFRTLLRFDLSAILGATVVDAALSLSLGANSSLTNETYSIHRLTQPSWTEFGVTWNTFDETNPWITPGGDFDATPVQSIALTTPQPLIYDNLKSLVQDAISLRGGMLDVLIKGTGITPGNQRLVVRGSGDPNPTLRPKLVVNYDFPPWCVDVADRAVWSVATADRSC
jgi:hypothetical protein